MADAGDIKARALLETAEFMGSLKQMVDGSTSAVTAASKQFDNMTSAIGKVTGVVATLGALGGLASFADSLIDTASRTDKLDAAFRNLNGNTAQTNALLIDLKDMEFTSLYDFEDTLGPAAKNMLVLGTNAAQVGPAMHAIADAAAGMKMGAEYVDEVSGSLANMSSHVNATGKDIKALQQEGAFQWTALTDVIGGTTEEAMTKVKKGLVSAQDVTTAVTNYLEGRWAGAAANSMDSWKGAMHILSETTEEARAAVGESIKGVLNDIAPLLQGAIHLVTDMTEAWKALPDGMKDAIVIIAGVAGAIVAATTAVSGLTVAWKLLSSAITGNAWGIAISLIVAALVALGEWVATHWDGVKAALQWMKDLLSGKMPTNSLAEAFTQAQTAADGLAASVKKARGEIETLTAGTGVKINLKGLSGQEIIDAAKNLKDVKTGLDGVVVANDKVATSTLTAKEQLEEQAKAAKKAAEVHKQYVEDVNKGYDTLKTASPEAAAVYAAAMDNVRSDTDRVAALFGTAWPKMSADMKQTVIDAISVSDAFKALGVTSESSLTDSVGKSEAAYQRLNDAATTTAADMVAANDKVVASVKTLADAQNKDLKEAYDAGAMAASDYYAMVETRAAAALAASVAANKGTVAGDEDVFAHRKLLADATKAMNDQAEKDAEAFAASIGQKTVKQLNDAAAAAGALQAAYDLLTPAGQKAADAFKAIGVATLDSQIKSVDDLAAALAKAQANSNGMISDQIALAAGAGKLDDAMKAVVTTLEQPYQQAIKDGTKTQKDANDAAIQGLRDLIRQWQLTGDESTAQQNKIAAAQRALDALVKQEGVDAAKQLTDAYHDFGLKTQDEYDKIVNKAQDDYAKILADGTASATQLKEARLRVLNDEYTAQQQMGTDVTTAQLNEYAKEEQDLKNHLDTTKSQWGDAYQGIHDAVGGMFDSLTKKLVTGDGSFHDIITGMWQSIAEACLNAFIQPVTKAIENFIATTLADLLTGKGGLSDVVDALKGIGKAATGVFGGASGAASGAAGGIEGDIGIGSLPLPGGNPLGGISAGLPGAASGAASGASAAVSGAMGMVNMVTGIVGAVGSIATAVGTFVEGTQMNNALNKIEESTRYSALLLGMQADGGIHQKVAEIRDSLNGGGHVWWELDSIRDNLNTHLEPIRTNSDSALTLLGQMTDLTINISATLIDIKGTMKESLASIAAATTSSGDTPKSITVNVSPQGLTTKEAAKALGDQIATNLTYQLA